jgi:plasmid stabilization system protein ParE
VKIVYSEPALRDLDEITDYLKQHYPGSAASLNGD